MNWQEILTILVPILSLLAWAYARIDKKFEQMDKNFEQMDKKFERRFEQLEHKMIEEFAEVKKTLHSLDMRLTSTRGPF